eukprot:1740849-Alexandrium_andersonii.AAC.1
MTGPGSRPLQRGSPGGGLRSTAASARSMRAGWATAVRSGRAAARFQRSWVWLRPTRAVRLLAPSPTE